MIGGGPPLADARAFGQWKAAHRLVERGAHVTLDDAATLGLARPPGGAPRRRQSPRRRTSRARSGAPATAAAGAARAYLLERGADLDWIPPWEDLTPLDAARREGAAELVAWLRERGARSASEPAA